MHTTVTLSPQVAASGVSLSSSCHYAKTELGNCAYSKWCQNSPNQGSMKVCLSTKVYTRCQPSLVCQSRYPA